MIAISYRREDSTAVTGRLHDRLEAEFGKANIFMDFDSIPFGVDFRERITQTLEQAKVVIAVIGPTWLGGRGKSNRRIDDPTDFVRLEIATALQRGIPVIPVLLDDTLMPKPESLPKDLQGLPFRNALMLDTGVDFHHHADRLIAGIRELVRETGGQSAKATVAKSGAGRTVAPEKEEKRLDSKKFSRVGVIGGGVFLLVIVIGLGFYIAFSLGRGDGPESRPIAPSPSPTSVKTETPPPTPSATLPPAAPAVVATMAPSAPAPPLLETPAPIMTQEEAQTFISNTYRAVERKDLVYLLSQYEDVVDYLDDGRRDKAHIREDLIKYFRRWPITSFSISNLRLRSSPGQNSVILLFDIRFFVRDVASSRAKTGGASEHWELIKRYGAIKIIAQHETVYSDAPSRR